MEDNVSLSDHTARLDIEQVGDPRIPARYTTTEKDPAATVRPTAEIPDVQERSGFELSPQISKSSKSIRLESPPVVIRPPKVKSVGFSHAALSWLSWNRNEEKDVPDCARSMHRSYSYRTTFRFLGFSLSKDINYRTSAGGIDTAMATIRLGWGSSEANWVLDKLPKIRQRLGLVSKEQRYPTDAERQSVSSREQSSTTAVENQKASNEPGRAVRSIAHPWLDDYHYVVVGILGDQTAPRESLRRVMRIDGLFQQIRKAHRQLRNPIRRGMSLKEVSGFGIYQCDPSKGHHCEVELDPETERALAELWRSYNTQKLDYEGRWLMWIHQHFNNGSKNAELGTLTLELKLRWSVFKVVFWGVVPILLSLAIGFWYMYSDHGEVDDVAVAEAAWVIATYIITTSACEYPFLPIWSRKVVNPSTQ
ncbi:hypothetical protein G647_06426 [Cladophialophora carrionii CBS 160.54]|uniref:Uncharacterized protein n=1 Tax=Cladophialophora carrionii CBS 160.54 TaxID=1279043 RepID=V9D8R1_9EURO|nr:uncharacterized protein G647_06426 [Cladophialophora carrionii CBS 160.54]ETI22352.1 hypothetical protein G647_06426 [Cladophialophora carrionii CBS 160.54]